LISYTDHQNIDISFALLPIGSVKAQTKWWFFRQQTEY
jgi:hypothetical protein